MIKHGLLIALLIGTWGCGRPHIRPLDASSVILAFGDSLTAGQGAAPQEAYPVILSNLLGCPVINAGVSGELSSEGLSRLPDLLTQHRPQLVIVCHGGNDLLAKNAEAAIQANLDAMIRLAKDQGTEVILIGVPKPGLLLRAPDFYQDLADRHKIPYDAKAISKILSSPSLKSDYVHPNAAGYQRMAEVIAELIRKSQK